MQQGILEKNRYVVIRCKRILCLDTSLEEATMKLHISTEAANYYKSEMDLTDGDYLQFYAKLYGGIPTAYPGYFLGISLGKEGDIAIATEVAGITFYFRKENEWILKEHEMHVSMNGNEVVFTYTKK